MALSIEQKYLALSTALDAIPLSFADNSKWLCVNGDTLGVYDKPTTYLAIIWELFSRLVNRLFCADKYTALQNRVIALTNELNDYLIHELDKRRGSDFIWKYTERVNVLFDLCFKMEQRGRIQGLVLDGSGPLQMWMRSPNGKNEIQVSLVNNSDEEVNVVLGKDERTGQPIYEKSIDSKGSMLVSLQGSLRSPVWDLAVSGKSGQPYPPRVCEFKYVCGIYRIEIGEPTEEIQISHTASACKTHEYDCGEFEKNESCDLVFSERGIEMQKVESTTPALTFRNETRNNVKVMFTCYNPESPDERIQMRTPIIWPKDDDPNSTANQKRICLGEALVQRARTTHKSSVEETADNLSKLNRIGYSVIVREYL